MIKLNRKLLGSLVILVLASSVYVTKKKRLAVTISSASDVALLLDGEVYSLPKEATVSSVVWKPVLPVKYGLVHMARSGGSVINHLLALKYERVCGNKGYSYNENEKNENARKEYSKGFADVDRTALIIANRKKKLSKSTHPANRPATMFKRGFDKCDYIAMEVLSNTWRKLHLHRPLELHIPCRDPIDHLMSMCAFRYKNFHCNVNNKELQSQVDDCISHFLNRFSMDMARSPHVTMKCFSSPSKIDDYIEYIGKTLQKKQIQVEYFDRTSNKFPRHKETECIWENVNKGLRKRLEKILLNHKSQYFKYCKDCIGSENDLLR